MEFIKKIFKKPTYFFSEKDLRWNRFIEEICIKELCELNDIGAMSRNSTSWVFNKYQLRLIDSTALEG